MVRSVYHSLLIIPFIVLIGCARLPRLAGNPTLTVPVQIAATELIPAITRTNTVVPTQSFTLTIPPTFTETPIPLPEVRFAIIGDYGTGNQDEQDVAELIKSWQPDFIITTGDNNYPSGAAGTIDQRIGQFFHEYIYPYFGTYGAGADQNRFFPALGNHDWDTDYAQPYLDYFTLPGNERYYDFTWGPLHLFALDSDSREPDGVGSSTNQADWLQEKLLESTAAWKIVYMHQPPYSSGFHGSVDWARWPYQDWGANVVVGGHDHSYERLVVNGFPYIVNGLGGGSIYDFGSILPESQVRYNADYGAMLVVANKNEITFQFITRQGKLVDSFFLQK